MRSPQERNTRLEDLDFGPKEEAGLFSTSLLCLFYTSVFVD